MKKKWVKTHDLPIMIVLDGCRVRYQGFILGYLVSVWKYGMWVKDDLKTSTVKPWQVPDDKTLKDIAEDLEFEISDG